jgi:hypothetical protein
MFLIRFLALSVGRTHSLKLIPYQSLIETLPSLVKLSNTGKSHLSLFLGGLFLLCLSDGISLSTGDYLDVSELIALSDSPFLEYLGVNLLGLLLVSPLVIEQFWRLISFIFKLLNGLNLESSLPALLVTAIKSRTQTAHGCRAPPIYISLF